MARSTAFGGLGAWCHSYAPTMSRIAAVHPVLPPHRYPQQDITEMFAEVCLGPDARRQLLQRLHDSAQVGCRYLALPLDRYRHLGDFGAANDAFLEQSVVLGSQAVLVSVELCSLTLQRDDDSTANLVASGLFGDGAAAVVMAGADREPPRGRSWDGPEVVDSRSHLYPGTERAMGWDIGASGLKIVLGPEVPSLVEQYLADDVKGLLAAHDLALEDVTGWVSHPGGPKVIQAIQSVLGLDDDALAVTWRSLAEVGNLSSASVLHVLHDTLAERTHPAGSAGVLMAMGPRFCAQLVLPRWGGACWG